jgi:hypothetical protein
VDQTSKPTGRAEDESGVTRLVPPRSSPEWGYAGPVPAVRSDGQIFEEPHLAQRRAEFAEFGHGRVGLGLGSETIVREIQLARFE